MRARVYWIAGACRYIALLWAGLAARWRRGSERLFRGELREGVLCTQGLRMSGTELGLEVYEAAPSELIGHHRTLADSHGERLTQPFAPPRPIPS